MNIGLGHRIADWAQPPQIRLWEPISLSELRKLPIPTRADRQIKDIKGAQPFNSPNGLSNRSRVPVATTAAISIAADLYDEKRGLVFHDQATEATPDEITTNQIASRRKPPDPRNANFDPRLWDPNFRPESAQSRPYEPPHDPEDPFAHSFDNTAGDILDGGRHGGSTGTIPPRREVVVRTGGGSAVISSDEQNPNEPRY